MSHSQRLICLTGATGYIGGRLLRLLEDRGQAIRCLARRPERLRDRVAETTETVAADVLDRSSLISGLAGVDTAYYLVHSLESKGHFEQDDRAGAENFAEAARTNGVRRIVYLGGLGDSSQGLSDHLKSRQEVGRILRRSQAQVIEFRASIIIGAGSLSFELIRALVERLPVMVCPRWVATPAQPIAVDDVLDYLLAAAELPDGESRVFEIGGPDQVSYGGIMREYARQRGLRRWMIPIPLLTPHLSSLWLALVTPVHARTGRKLVDGLRNPTVVRDDSARNVFAIRPQGLREAIAAALAKEP
ncbi:MAG: NAD(P)H-binding protein [Pirellulaceae bacterium]|nr:NAD(P)H-binding protein [Pirellulaceae bacterium]